MKIFRILTILASLAIVYNWECAVHSMIYGIAMKGVSKEIAAQIISEINEIKGKGAEYSEWLEYACWMDDMGELGGLTAFDGFHRNYEALYNGVPINQYYKVDPIYNVINIIEESIKTLNFSKNSKDSDSTFDGKFQKSFALRMLIHFIGDIHQPLHMATQFTPDHPNGDRGGKEFKIQNYYPTIHALWDDCLGIYPDLRKVYIISHSLVRV